MLRILVAGMLGGVAMYAWSAVAHMVGPLGQAGFSTIANEAAVTTVLQSELKAPGLYIFPGAMAGPQATGPSGILAYSPTPNEFSLDKLGLEAAVEVLESIVAAVLLSVTALVGYLRRVAFVTGVGVAAALASDPSLTIWYGFPTAYLGAAIVVNLVGYLVAGLVIAAILKPRAAAA